MKKYSWLSLVLILIFVLGTLIFLSPLIMSKSLSNWPIKQKLNLGLDLKGGMQIVLDVDTKNLSASDVTAAVDNNIEIIRNRIDQFGVAEPTIQKLGENSIVVQLPGVRDPLGAEKLVRRTAMLEFKLVADADESEKVIAQIDDFTQRNLALFPSLAKLDKEDKALQDSLGLAADTLKTESGVFKSLIGQAQNNYVVKQSDLSTVTRLLRNPRFQEAVPKGYELSFESLSEQTEDKTAPRPIYILRSNAQVSGTDLDNARMEIGSSTAQDPKIANKPYISLEFNRQGARKFERVTGDNVDKRLAIVVDSLVYSAPVIQDRIPDGKAIITGVFSRDEARSLAILLNNKSLSAPLIPVSSTVVGASLGADSIRAGAKAGLIGIIAVMLFMLIYYKLSGLVADFVLVFNVGFILAALTAFGGTLTLPGIAGIILTIGMAVDANVLIYERIREELDAGRTPHTAVDAGYKRAVVTIWDANITTLIAAFVLYQFGTGPVRGFALTLAIGIVGSMFCAIVFVRAIMEKVMLSGNSKTMSI
jgi:protein-export membrane protein SecD